MNAAASPSYYSSIDVCAKDCCTATGTWHTTCLGASRRPSPRRPSPHRGPPAQRTPAHAHRAQLSVAECPRKLTQPQPWLLRRRVDSGAHLSTSLHPFPSSTRHRAEMTSAAGSPTVACALSRSRKSALSCLGWNRGCTRQHGGRSIDRTQDSI